VFQRTLVRIFNSAGGSVPGCWGSGLCHSHYRPSGVRTPDQTSRT
jgi:hypothetical protein